jgi:CheY-like chemotaxis protein
MPSRNYLQLPTSLPVTREGKMASKTTTIFEVRTLMNSLIGMIQITLDLGLPRDQHEYQEVALASAKRIAAILEEFVLDRTDVPAETPSDVVQEPAIEREPLTILIAEDNIINKKVLQKILAKRGHTIHAVENGFEAANAVASEHFDIVIMDIKMPLMDGVQSLQIIREQDRARERYTPIIALSAWEGDTAPDEGKDHRFDAYIPKPLDVTKLIEALYTSVDRAKEKQPSENV